MSSLVDFNLIYYPVRFNDWYKNRKVVHVPM